MEVFSKLEPSARSTILLTISDPLSSLCKFIMQIMHWIPRNYTQTLMLHVFLRINQIIQSDFCLDSIGYSRTSGSQPNIHFHMICSSLISKACIAVNA